MSGYLLAFFSTHDGVATKMALRNHFRFTILPTPREISASCGISILIAEEDFAAVRALLLARGLDDQHVALYRAAEHDGKRGFTPLALEPQ